MNEARNLLNFIDEHKTELKDNTYKNIVDMISNINKQFEEQKSRELYTCVFLLTKSHFSKDDDETNTFFIDNTVEDFTVDFYLTEEEYNIVKTRLDNHNYMCNLWQWDDDYPGLGLIQQTISNYNKKQSEMFAIDTNFLDNMHISGMTLSMIKQQIADCEVIDLIGKTTIHLLKIFKKE